MNVKDFYYDLPEELIAQDPLEDRSSSKLLVLDKESGELLNTYTNSPPSLRQLMKRTSLPLWRVMPSEWLLPSINFMPMCVF